VQGMNYNLFGDKYLEVPNEPDALVVNYYLKADAASAPRITVAEPGSRVLRELQGTARAGLNRVNVSLAGSGRGRGAGAAGGATTASQGRGGVAPSGPLPVGDYVVTLTVGDQTQAKPARVRDRIR
jgi:hypothetical protein